MGGWGGIRQVSRLAWHDWWQERLLSACSVLALAAVLAPLLVLFGVKFGVIDTISQRLLQDPVNRQLIPQGSGHYRQDWFEMLTARQDVAFVIAQTRSIAATMDLLDTQAPAGERVVAELIPTSVGDPLLSSPADVPSSDDQVVLSEAAARKLGVAAGATITGRLGRVLEGQRQQATITLTVRAVLPLAAYNREAAFVSLDLLTACEDYRDGFGCPRLGWPGHDKPAGAREFASFRIYAKTLEDVPPLREFLQSKHIDVYTRAHEIETVQSLDHAFSVVFKLIALVAMGGYFFSTASSMLANVRRKCRHLGILRLIGFTTGNITWFPMAQAILTSLLGAVLAFALYLSVQIVINHLFASYLNHGEAICRLLPSHYLLAGAFTTLVSVAASALAAWKASGIEPSEVIRDV